MKSILSTIIILGLILLSGSLSAASAVAAKPAKGDLDFRIEIPGIGDKIFHSIDGVGLKVEIIEHDDGTPVLRKLPGRTKYGDITLKRGYIANDFDLFNWVKSVGDGTHARGDLTVEVLPHNSDTPLTEFNLISCFPVSYEMSESDSESDLATEAITVACDRVEFGRAP